MPANGESSASWKWRPLYEAAVLELDSRKVPQRIAEAERAVMDRMAELDMSGDASESGALINALNVLRDLRKMTDSRARSEK